MVKLPSRCLCCAIGPGKAVLRRYQSYKRKTLYDTSPYSKANYIGFFFLLVLISGESLTALSASVQRQSQFWFIVSPLLADPHASAATVGACGLCVRYQNLSHEGKKSRGFSLCLFKFSSTSLEVCPWDFCPFSKKWFLWLKCDFISPPAQPSSALRVKGTITSVELKNLPALLLFVPCDVCLHPECSDGDCPGSVVSSLLLTLITSCVMRLHMYCAKSQIAVLIWDSLVLELVVSVLSCLTGLFGNKPPWTVCFWLLVSGPCYLTVPVGGNFELTNVKPALPTPGFLSIAVSSHVSSDLTPEILNLLMMWAAFYCCSCSVIGGMFFPCLLSAPATCQQPLANSLSPGCHSSGKSEVLILWPVSTASQQGGVVHSNAGNALNVSCGDPGVSCHSCFSCYLLQELESTGISIVIHKHLSACRLLLDTHVELVAVVLSFFPFLICVPRSSVCAVGWEGTFLQLAVVVLFCSSLQQSAERCVSTLLDLIQTKVNYVVQEAIVVIRDIFRKYPNKYVEVVWGFWKPLSASVRTEQRKTHLV